MDDGGATERWLAVENIRRFQSKLDEMDRQRTVLENLLRLELARLQKLGGKIDDLKR